MSDLDNQSTGKVTHGANQIWATPTNRGFEPPLRRGDYPPSRYEALVGEPAPAEAAGDDYIQVRTFHNVPDQYGQPRPDREYNHDDRTVELLQLVGRDLIQAAPASWQRLDFEFRGIATVCDYSLWCTMHDGAIHQIPEPLFVADRAMRDLRHIMYEPHRGTWFLARYNIADTMEYRIVYDYDNDPLWRVPTDVENWKADLIQYPRDPEYMPEWLRNILLGQYKYLNERGDA